LEDMIDPHLLNQMDQEALRIFSEIVYCCIKEERADRPHIDQVVKGLEKALKLQSMYENPVRKLTCLSTLYDNNSYIYLLMSLSFANIILGTSKECS
jgi:hypothetical protein